MKKYYLYLLCLIAISTRAQFVINGSATPTGNDCYQLTTNGTFEVGTIWNSQKVNLTNDFKIDFQLNFGTKDANGADGIAFCLQQVSTSVGAAGGGIGYEGVQPSLTVEFDTWSNSDRNDPSYDHMSIMENGDLDHNSAQNLAGPVQIDPNNINVEDGQWKEVSIEWRSDSNELVVLYDCVEQLSYKGDVVKDIFQNDPNTFWGFTSATGGSSNIQQVCVTIQTLNQDQGSLGCSDTVQLNGPNGAVNYNWYPNVNMSDNTAEDPSVFPLDTTRYYLEYEDRCGKTWLDSIDVNVTNILPVELPNDTLACVENPLLFNVENSPLATYLWNTGDTDYELTASDTGWYEVVVTVGECKDSSSVHVDFRECKMWIPNIMTPNGDGVNDEFIIANISQVGDLHLKVYNRWGRKVYENEHYQNNWDGRRGGDGRQLASGVYFYVVYANEADYEVYNGFVTIVHQ